MRGKLQAARALVAYELSRACSPGRWIPTVLIAALPLVILALAMGHVPASRAPRAFFMITTSLYLSLLPLATAIVHAIPSSSSGMSEAASTYIFSGVLGRGRIYLLKALSLWLFSGAHLVASIALAQVLFSPEERADRITNLRRLSELALLGSAVWTAYYLTAGYIFRRPLAVSIAACLIFELVIGVLPFDVARYTIYQSLRAIARERLTAGGEPPGPWFRMIGRIEFQEAGDALLYLGIVLAILLLAGVVALRRRRLSGPAPE